MYPEIFSTNWVKLNGMEENCYSKTVPIMLTSMDLLESCEFEKLKIYRECNLLNRSIIYTNRCGTHK